MKGIFKTQDYTYRDNLWDYGYVGKFDVKWVPLKGNRYSRGPFPGLAHAGYLNNWRDIQPVPQSSISKIIIKANCKRICWDIQITMDFHPPILSSIWRK